MPQQKRNWLVLLVSLPPTSSRVRVGIWRKLKRMGAVSLKGAAWMLPQTRETIELFQWLAQEIETLEGEAALLYVEHIEPLGSDNVAALFRQERAAEYEAVRRVCEATAQAVGRRAPRSADEIRRFRSKLTAAKRELDRVTRIDYLGTPEGEAVRALYEQVDMKLRATEIPTKKAPSPKRNGLPPARSTWVTRPRPHIDRIASAWLVKRFHDATARFVFAEDPASVKRGVPFDTLGAEFGHHGEDCTFETILKRLGTKDRRLKAIAEMVHEADLRDGKFSRAEAAGLDMTLTGLASTHPDDRDLLNAGMAVFDALYAGLGEPKGT